MTLVNFNDDELSISFVQILNTPGLRRSSSTLTTLSLFALTPRLQKLLTNARIAFNISVYTFFTRCLSRIALISTLNNGSTLSGVSYLLQPLIPDLRLVIAYCLGSLAHIREPKNSDASCTVSSFRSLGPTKDAPLCYNQDSKQRRAEYTTLYNRLPRLRVTFIALSLSLSLPLVSTPRLLM